MQMVANRDGGTGFHEVPVIDSDRKGCGIAVKYWEGNLNTGVIRVAICKFKFHRTR